MVAAWLIGAGLSLIHATAAGNAHVLDYLAVEVVLRLDHMADVDPAVDAGVGALVLVVGRYGERIAGWRYSVLVHRVPPVGPGLGSW